MKKWIWIVLLIAVIAGGAYWWIQQNQSASSQAITKASVKVGDKIGDLTVKEIIGDPHKKRVDADPDSQDDFIVTFSGQTTLKGTWSVDDYHGVIVFNVDKSDNPQLPHFLFMDSSVEAVAICLSNEDEARAALADKSGTVSIKITDYVANFATYSEFCDRAKLIR